MAHPHSCVTIENDPSLIVQNSGSCYQSDCLPPSYEEGHLADLPPPYSDTGSPPCYNEVIALHRNAALQKIFGYSDDDLDVRDQSLSHNLQLQEEETPPLGIGSDYAFVGFFFLSFVLNWIGCLFGYVFGNSLAARYGATAGFGLSLINWVLVIKHAYCCVEILIAFPWIMWLLLIAGWIMFLRGVLLYSRSKRGGDRGWMCFL